MYEQFSIDSKLLKPNLSFLKSIEENNSKINYIVMNLTNDKFIRIM